MEEEHDNIPVRVREHSEQRIAELDEMGRDAGESTEARSFGESEAVSKTEDKVD